MAYQSYDPSVDYADRLRRMMQAGASAAEVESVLRQRVNKATSEPGHEQYAYDAYYTATVPSVVCTIRARRRAL